MRAYLVAGFLSFSVVNSWVMASFSAPLHSLVRAAVKCENKCTETLSTQGECYHLGFSDPCSTITCILNEMYCPSCKEKNSGGVSPCPYANKNYVQQTRYDQPCSGKSAWELIIFQNASTCAPAVGGNCRCKNACGVWTSKWQHLA